MSLLWKLGGVAILLAVGFFLVRSYGASREEAGETRGRSEERTQWQAKVIEAERGRLVAFQAGLAQRDEASTHYRETVRQLPPITNRIVERTTQYAATPAGAAVCLDADRVREIERDRAILFAAPSPAAAAGSAGAMPAPRADPQP